MSYRALWKALALVLCAVLFTGCNWFAKRRCEWYIVPDLTRKDMVEPPWATVCIKNYNLGKQRCFMKIRIADGEAVLNKTVRYNDLEIDTSTMPRTIKSAQPCTR